MMRSIVIQTLLALLVLCSALSAAPRYARVMVGSSEAALYPRPVFEKGEVYAPVSVLKNLGINYAEGNRKITALLGDKTAEISLVNINGSNMLRLSDVAESAGVGLRWDDAASTARLLSRIESVDMQNGVLSVQTSLPVSITSMRLYENPLRVAIDFRGVSAGSARTIDIGGGYVKRIRIAQFDSETARIVVDLNSRVAYKALTKGRNAKTTIAFGQTTSSPEPKKPAVVKTPAAAASVPSVKPPSPAVTTKQAMDVNAIDVRSVSDSSAVIRIRTSSKPVFKTSVAQAPRRLIVDVANARLAIPSDAPRASHPLFTAIRTGQQPEAARVVFDLTSYVNYTAELDGDGIKVTLTKPTSIGGSLSDKVVVLDAGHGGKDPGARSGDVLEKDLNLLIAKRVKEELEANGVRTLMTREDDTFIELKNRPAVANKAKADFFISLHCNAIGPERLSGIETYHSGKADSASFAHAIHDSVVKTTGMKDRGARVRPTLAVLRYSQTPALLLECGYIDHSSDRAKLCDDEYRGQLAKAIVAGLKHYVEGKIELEGR